MAIERRRITIRANAPFTDREVDAVIVGQRVAVHRGLAGHGWTISDPVTGLAYHWDGEATETSMLRKARAFVRKFGTNPLRGMRMRGDKVIRKPPRADEMREFF